MDAKTLKIQQLNDQFRRQVGADWYMSRGVAELSNEKKRQLLSLVINFNLFNEGNDPYGEHDFGQVKLDNIKYFWKISYYDKNLEYGSPDASDPTVTRRVMNIMEASEY
ncbi:MAG: DUF3768 domain-containing protein [Microcoleaceae cyanobacterium]